MQPQQVLKFILFSASATCLFTPAAQAINILKPATTAPTGGPVLMADAICGYRSGAIQYYETTNYRIYICNRNGNLTYVGLEKGNESSNIYLPIDSFENGTYSAVNGEYRYNINAKELIVTRNGRVVGRERVLAPGN